MRHCSLLSVVLVSDTADMWNHRHCHATIDLGVLACESRESTKHPHALRHEVANGWASLMGIAIWQIDPMGAPSLRSPYGEAISESQRVCATLRRCVVWC